MAAGTMHITGMITPVETRAAARRSVQPQSAQERRGPGALAGITPEFYFQKTIDNSRLVRVSDPQRRREIRMFSACVVALFLLVMFYAWQHFSSIEYGYKIETQKAERDRLVELNRTLKLEAASLRDPSRIDALARQMGLESPEPGQVIPMNPDEAGTPVMASAAPVAVITAR